LAVVVDYGLRASLCDDIEVAPARRTFVGEGVAQGSDDVGAPGSGGLGGGRCWRRSCWRGSRVFARGILGGSEGGEGFLSELGRLAGLGRGRRSRLGRRAALAGSSRAEQ